MLNELIIAALLLKISAHFLNCDASAACGQKLKLLFLHQRGTLLTVSTFLWFCIKYFVRSVVKNRRIFSCDHYLMLDEQWQQGQQVEGNVKKVKEQVGMVSRGNHGNGII